MPHLFLYGPPGTGKSTIGKQLSRNLNLPFIDLDRVIETKAGKSIPQLMEEHGELAFRDLETAALKEIAGTQDKIVALGGGALLRDENRLLAEDSGKVIVLLAAVETLFQRLNASSNKRPLLSGDLRAKLTALLENRAEHYNSFPLHLSVDHRTVKQSAYHAQIVFGRHHISAMGGYDVIIAPIGDLDCNTPLIVTDENVAKLHLEKIVQSVGNDAKSVVISAGEEHKNLETISVLWKAFLENGLDRKSTVIALGGGMVSDLVGFAASTYMRGINWVCIPTTLLSMVDASLGGKTGFDLPEGKNLIGSFHPPKLVLADPKLLETLPDRELRSGMAEVVKHGMISDPELFVLCSRGMSWIKNNLEEIVKRAMTVKIKIIEEDPYEQGFRAALNLGHTVGHAVELVSGFELRHGEAISIGIVTEARYAEKIGLARKGMAEQILDVLSAIGLPVRIPQELVREDIIQAMRVDKKRSKGVVRFALPVEIGRVELVEVMDLEEVL